MKMTLSTSEAVSILVHQSEAFTYRAAEALVEYLDEDMELDPIALRCEYSEHSSATEWADDYFGGHAKALDALDIETEEDEDEDKDAIEDAAKEYIRDNGTLIEFDGGVIVSSF